MRLSLAQGDFHACLFDTRKGTMGVGGFGLPPLFQGKVDAFYRMRGV